MTAQSEISRFAVTTFRHSGRSFGIKQPDRLLHTLALGQTGTGKSCLLELLALADLAAGRGFALIDPHGDLVERVHASVPPKLRDRVVYLDATDPGQPFGYNPLRRVSDTKIQLAASGLMETMRKLWGEKAWGVRMEHVLRNSLYALLERDGSTLPDVLRLYADKTFRRQVTASIRNPVVRQFWLKEWPAYGLRQAEAVAPIQNKVGALLSDPTLYRILVAPAVDVRFRSLMDEGRVLLVNLSTGRLGEDSAVTLGSLLVSTLGLASLTRAEVPPEKRKPFFLYVDEFQTFTTRSFVSLAADLRKVGVGLVLATQTMTLIEPDIRHAVLANCGTLLSFRVGPEDAATMANEFQPTFGVEDLLNLPNRHFYLKLMIDGAPSRPFSGRTLDA